MAVGAERNSLELDLNKGCLLVHMSSLNDYLASPLITIPLNRC